MEQKNRADQTGSLPVDEAISTRSGEEKNMEKALVLSSGGVDSTTCLALAVDRFSSENVIALSVYYGQKHAKEVEAAKAVAKHYGVEHITMDLTDIFAFSDSSLLNGSSKEIPMESYAEQLKKQNGAPVTTYVPFRNGIFLSTAAAVALSKGCSYVYYGAHADDAAGNAYPDCSQAFKDAMNSAIYEGSGKALTLVAPFIACNKAEVVKAGLSLGVPYELTWSCYSGSDRPCGTCATCIDRRKAFEANGVEDPAMNYSSHENSSDAYPVSGCSEAQEEPGAESNTPSGASGDCSIHSQSDTQVKPEAGSITPSGASGTHSVSRQAGINSTDGAISTAASGSGRKNGLTLLGNQKTVYASDYAPEVLETFQNKHPEHDYFVKFNCPEFTSLCPITGQPDFATVYISYVPDERMVESKSLKLYLFSFRNHGDFHEDCMNIIMNDLIQLMEPKYIEVWGKFTPRGGISIDPYCNYGKPGTRWEEVAWQRLSQHDLYPEKVDNR